MGGGCVGQVGGLQTAFSDSPIAVGAPITCRPWINVSDIRYFFQDIYDIDFLTFINARRKLKHCHLTEMVRELVSVVETMRPRAKPTMAATTTGFPNILAVFIVKNIGNTLQKTFKPQPTCSWKKSLFFLLKWNSR